MVNNVFLSTNFGSNGVTFRMTICGHEVKYMISSNGQPSLPKKPGKRLIPLSNITRFFHYEKQNNAGEYSVSHKST